MSPTTGKAFLLGLIPETLPVLGVIRPHAAGRSRSPRYAGRGRAGCILTPEQHCAGSGSNPGVRRGHRAGRSTPSRLGIQSAAQGSQFCFERGSLPAGKVLLPGEFADFVPERRDLGLEGCRPGQASFQRGETLVDPFDQRHDVPLQLVQVADLLLQPRDPLQRSSRRGRYCEAEHQVRDPIQRPRRQHRTLPRLNLQVTRPPLRTGGSRYRSRAFSSRSALKNVEAGDTAEKTGKNWSERRFSVRGSLADLAGTTSESRDQEARGELNRLRQSSTGRRSTGRAVGDVDHPWDDRLESIESAFWGRHAVLPARWSPPPKRAQIPLPHVPRGERASQHVSPLSPGAPSCRRSSDRQRPIHRDQPIRIPHHCSGTGPVDPRRADPLVGSSIG